MTQMILNIKDEKVIPTLSKVVRAFDGVTVARPKRSAYEQSKYEARTGHVFHAKDASDMIRQILG
ncbi:MAG: hypothetical protein II891_06875 [Bacteroidales bacterium]|nr:hypothetical protein [Bacteroidales bacterium]